MTNKPHPSPGLDALSSTANTLTDDPEFRAYTRTLVIQSLRELSRILSHGTDDAKMRVITRILPAVTKAIEASSSHSDDVATLRAEFQSLMREMAGDTFTLPDSSDPDAPLDPLDDPSTLPGDDPSTLAHVIPLVTRDPPPSSTPAVNPVPAYPQSAPEQSTTPTFDPFTTDTSPDTSPD